MMLRREAGPSHGPGGVGASEAPGGADPEPARPPYCLRERMAGLPIWGAAPRAFLVIQGQWRLAAVSRGSPDSEKRQLPP